MATHPVQLGPGLGLPLEAVTETFAILAKRGAGKTSTAVVLTEELIGAGQQVVVIDPVGVWFGLRSNADGTGPGLPVVIVGGDHADLPLEETAGRALARLLVSQRASAVLDLSHLSKSAARRLVADFLEELYRVNRDPMHLVVDEADLVQNGRALADDGDTEPVRAASSHDVVHRPEQPGHVTREPLRGEQVAPVLGSVRRPGPLGR